MTPHEASFRFYTRFRGRRRLSAVELQLRCVPPCVGRRSAGEATDSGEHSSHGRCGGGDAAAFVLINASPDLRQQILATPALHPRGLRDSPIAAVVLTGGEVDQTAGLLTLRERGPFALFATADTLCDAGRQCDLQRAGGRCGGAARRFAPATAFGLPGGIDRRAVHRARQGAALSRRRQSGAGSRNRGQCRHRVVAPRDARLVFIPGAAKLTPAHRWRGCAAPTWCCSTARCSPTTK